MNGDIAIMCAIDDISDQMFIRTTIDLGLVIRSRRRELGLTQQALADEVGVSRQWIVEMEKGKARAEAGLVLRSLRVLGLLLVVEPSDTSRPGEDPPVVDVDIDAVITRARGRES